MDILALAPERTAPPDDPIWVLYASALVITVLVAVAFTLAVGGWPSLEGPRRRKVLVGVLVAAVLLGVGMLVFERVAYGPATGG